MIYIFYIKIIFTIIFILEILIVFVRIQRITYRKFFFFFFFTSRSDSKSYYEKGENLIVEPRTSVSSD